jgi:hypothetical protein
MGMSPAWCTLVTPSLLAWYFHLACRFVLQMQRSFFNVFATLCQDTDAAVRRAACEQLPAVIRIATPDAAGRCVVELLELLTDEEVSVCRSCVDACRSDPRGWHRKPQLEHPCFPSQVRSAAVTTMALCLPFILPEVCSKVALLTCIPVMR